MLKSERKGVRNSDSSDADVWAFGNTPQLPAIGTVKFHHNTTFKCYLLSTFPSPFGNGDQDLKE